MIKSIINIKENMLAMVLFLCAGALFGNSTHDHYVVSDTFPDFEQFENFDFGPQFDGLDSMLTQTLSMLFEGDQLKNMTKDLEKMGGDMQKMSQDFEIFGEDFFEKLGPQLEQLGQGLGGLEKLEGLEGLQDLSKIFEGLDLDSTMTNFQFFFDGDMGNIENLEQMFKDQGFEVEGATTTVVDKMKASLNKDGLLEEHKVNEVILTGKYLKINGKKVPTAIYNKYKRIYEENTGAPLTSKSKMIFDIEGTASKRTIKTF